jgi:hypothetical protein
MNDTLAQRIGELPDEELLLLLTTEADKYRAEALALARAEAERRNLDVDAPGLSVHRDGSTLGEAFRAFATGVSSEFRAGRFTAAGKPIACPHCGGEVFELRSAVVNTRALTFLRLDWLNRGAAVLVCESCGLFSWFRSAPERVPPVQPRTTDGS